MADESHFILKYGCGIGVGGRKYQEDRLVATDITANIDNPKSYFFAVFDGHGGDRASSLLCKDLYNDVKNHPKFTTLPIVALQESWARFDDKIYNEFRRLEKANNLRAFPSDGSTASVCLVSGNDLYITNCGDSACYSIMPDGTTELLTEDHGTNNPEEVDRCVKAGGTLREQQYSIPAAFPFCCFGVPQPTKPRIMPGGLLVTRSFGDFGAKVDFLGGRKAVIVPTHGRIKYINAAKSMPKYIVLGSDGIWDAISIEQVAQMISKHTVTPTSTTETTSVPSASAPAPSSTATPPSAIQLTCSKVGPSESRSQTDMVEAANSNSASAHGMDNAYVNAPAAQLDAGLNKLAADIVHAAVTSPKWKQQCK